MTIKRYKLKPKMSLKITLNYSPNFEPIKRKLGQIKFIVFHYTGMKKESEAINRLTDIQSEVSSHYLIKNNGEIVCLVPDLYIAWHAGISSWKNYRSLNKNSIGIEISNPGHSFKYKKFSKKQINSIQSLSKFLIKKYKIKSKNFLGHSDVSPTRKKDPGEKFPWKHLSKYKIGNWHSLNKDFLFKRRNLKTNNIEKKIFFKNLIKVGYIENLKNIKGKYSDLVTIAFQRRYRQEKISGIIDQECLIISKNLAKNLS